jgi:SAM-dependent methyltransferase
MERYYPATYYSYAARRYNRIAGWMKGRRDRYYLDGTGVIGQLLSYVSPASPYIEWLRNLALPYGSTILEAGSGAGTLIVNLQDVGFPSVGVDPYIAGPINCANGARVLKQSLAETTGSFDCIMMHHCLEHMAAPEETFRHVHRLLKPGGKVLVRIPVAGTHAWKTYGHNWFQLDAPRHFVIFTEAALRTLAERSGFSITKIIYDSQSSQFWASEQYVKGIALANQRSYALHPEESIFLPEQIAEYDRQAALLNAKSDGDQAAFYLSKAR